MLLLAGILLGYRLQDPPDVLIFDEKYYVQAARVIQGLPVTEDGLPSDWVNGLDPNREHPPLAKLVIAKGLDWSQGDPIGWRLPSIVLGLLTLVSTYAVVVELTQRRSLARWSVAFLATENLFFIHSRIATLEIYVLAFSALATWLYLRRLPELAALSLAVATACKLTGIFGFVALVLYEMLTSLQRRRLGRRPLLALTFFYLSFSLSLLGMLDCYCSEFRSPIQHLQHIVRFGSGLNRPPGVAPQGIESTPIQWWMNEKDFDYAAVSVSSNGATHNTIRFRSQVSPYLLSAAPFALAFCATRAWGGQPLPLLVLCLTAANYLPFLVTWITMRRICYLYYLLPCIPALAVGVACSLEELPRWVSVLFAVASCYAFASLFPFQG